VEFGWEIVIKIREVKSGSDTDVLEDLINTFKEETMGPVPFV